MTIEDPITRRGVMAGAAATAVLAATRATAQRASSNDDLTRLSIGEAGRRIAARELSPVELTRAYLERIESVDPRVNSYITVTADRALEQARALEAELARGQRRGPLHGIPIGLKDNIDTAGILTTAASAVYADRIPTEDAECVRKLRDAGAVFLGKLNMHEFAYGGTSAVTHYGPVHNPWDLDVQPRRLVGRLGRGRRGAALRGGARHGHGRVGALPGRVLRCRGAQGDAWAREHSRHRAALGVPRSRRPARAQRRRLRARDDGARGLRSARSREHPGGARGLSRRDRPRRAALRIGIPRSPFFEQLDPEIDAAVRAALDGARRSHGARRAT